MDIPRCSVFIDSLVMDQNYFFPVKYHDKREGRDYAPGHIKRKLGLGDV